MSAAAHRWTHHMRPLIAVIALVVVMLATVGCEIINPPFPSTCRPEAYASRGCL